MFELSLSTAIGTVLAPTPVAHTAASGNFASTLADVTAPAPGEQIAGNEQQPLLPPSRQPSAATGKNLPPSSADLSPSDEADAPLAWLEPLDEQPSSLAAGQTVPRDTDAAATSPGESDRSTPTGSAPRDTAIHDGRKPQLNSAVAAPKLTADAALEGPEELGDTKARPKAAVGDAAASSDRDEAVDSLELVPALAIVPAQAGLPIAIDDKDAAVDQGSQPRTGVAAAVAASLQGAAVLAPWTSGTGAPDDAGPETEAAAGAADGFIAQLNPAGSVVGAPGGAPSLRVPAPDPSLGGNTVATLQSPAGPAATPPAPSPLQALIGVPQPAGQAFATQIAAAAKPLRRDHDDEIGVAAPAPSISTSLSTVDKSNAAGTAAPIDTGHPDWAKALIDRIDAIQDVANARDTRIRLVPDALGRIDVALRRQGDTLHVHFTAEVPATRVLLAEAQPRLAELADARGLRLSQAGVGTNGSNQGQDQRRSPAAPEPEPNHLAATSQGDDSATDRRIA